MYTHRNKKQQYNQYPSDRSGLWNTVLQQSKNKSWRASIREEQIPDTNNRLQGKLLSIVINTQSTYDGSYLPDAYQHSKGPIQT